MDSIHFVEIFTSIALLLAASFAFDLANAGNRTHPGRRVAVGVLVGLLGCALMFSGWSVTTGAKLDARSVLLSITGLYFGFVPSLVAALIVGAVRMEMGGAGAATGLLVIAVATASGLAVRRWRAPEAVAYRWPELLGFGVAVHALALGCVVAMPGPGVAPTLSLALVPALAIAPVLTMALGLVLNYRLKQQRAATALARSEERFALVLRGSNDAPWDWDRVADRFYYSPRWWEILGYRDGELPADPMLWHRLLHPDDVARVDANLESALASGRETFEVEYRLRHRDGHYVPLLGRAVIVRDAGGRAVRIAGVTSDLTERNRVASALAASEDRFRRMLAASPDLVCTTDLARRITYAPATSRTGFGLRAEDEIVGVDFVDLLAATDRDAARARFAALARGERVGPAEYTFVAGGGAALPVEVNADVLKSADGTAEGFFVIVRDLTLRRETERALRLSEARLRGVTENAADIIVELDPAGRIVYINRVLAGYRQDEVLGRDFLDWAPPEFHAVMRAALRRVFVEREAAAYEAKGAGQHGEVRWYASRLSPVIVGNEVKSAILVTRDITRRHAADDALRAREHTYRAVLSTARDGFWMLDLQGRLQDVNEAYVRMSGYRREELLALSVSNLAVGQGPAEVAARMRECIERGGLRFETRHRRRDGREIVAEVNASFSPDDGGRVFAFIRDIGERKRAEAIVRARFDLAALVPQGSAESLVQLGIDAAARVTASSCAGFELVDEARAKACRAP